MVNGRPRIAGLLVGDIYLEPGARVKYGAFFQALARRLPVVHMGDVTLRGVGRYLNALRAVHPSPAVWRERFYKNIPAFKERSRKAESFLMRVVGDVDVALQVGVTFDATGSGLPVVLYLDYTARLSARKSGQGRSPFNQAQRQEWLALERRTYARAAHICVRSRQVKHSLLEDYGVDPRKITVVGGGANFIELPDDHQPRDNRAETTILFIGKEFHRKGGDLLLHAFALARKTDARARLVMVTAGPIPSELPLDGVDIVRPTWDRKKIAALYSRADIFVLPSRLETWGDVLLEAMGYGLPCIGVDDDAMSEIIVDGQTGRLVPPEDVPSLTRALIELLGDGGWRRKWGLSGRRRVEELFTWDEVAARFEAALVDASGLDTKINVEKEFTR